MPVAGTKVPRTNVRSSRSKNRLDVSRLVLEDVPAKNGRMSRSTARSLTPRSRSAARVVVSVAASRWCAGRRASSAGHRCKTRLVLHAADGSECREGAQVGRRRGSAIRARRRPSSATMTPGAKACRCSRRWSRTRHPRDMRVVELEPAIQQEAVDIVGAYPATDVVEASRTTTSRPFWWMRCAARPHGPRPRRRHRRCPGARAVDHQGTLPTAPRAAPLDLWTSKPVDNRRRSTANSVSLVVCRTSRFPATSSIDSSASGAPARYGPRIRLRVGPPSR